MHTLIKFIKEFQPREIIAFLLLVALFISATTLLALRIQTINELALTNQGYVRYTACMIDIRNQQNVTAVREEISEACWKQAEIESNMPLDRYNEKVLLNTSER